VRDINSGRLTLTDWFKLCAEELGLTAVELEDHHIGEPTAARLAEIRSAADRFRLEIVNIALMNNFGLADAAARRAEQERTVRWMDASKTLRTKFLRTFAGWPEGDRGARWPDMLETLRHVAGAAQTAGVRLVMENHNHNGFVRTSDDAQMILDAVASPSLGLLLDTGNFLDGLPGIERTARRAWHVHAKFTRVMPDGGDAKVDYPAVIRLLRNTGYDGWVSLEYEGEEASRDAVPRALACLRQLLAA
jgi:sugar phosphate isomerase/epimerase